MRNFTYFCPVKAIFGDDALEKLAEICKNRRVLLIYGGSSPKRTGAYRQIREILTQAGACITEFGGHVSAEYEAIVTGIRLCKEKRIDCVLGAGGASVMDMAKCIAFGAVHDNYDAYFARKLEADNSEKIMTVLVPTYPSAGSEADGLGSFSHFHDGKDGGLHGVFADYAVLYPPFTFSLDKRNTAYSCIVTLIQASVYYYDNRNTLARCFAADVMKTVLQSYDILLRNPKNYKARANILWASFVTTMGVLDIGMDGTYGWSVYAAGNTACDIHGLSYREGLVVVYPRWLRAIAKHHPQDIRDFMVNILGVDDSYEQNEIIEEGVNRVFALLEKGELPDSFLYYAPQPDEKRMDVAVEKEYDGSLTKEEMKEILRECYREKKER